ncbi:hypothetical protein T4A_14497, partial [Trichinella pseudospiralis]
LHHQHFHHQQRHSSRWCRSFCQAARDFCKFLA